MELYLNLIRATKMSVCQNYPAGNFVWCCSGAVNNLYEIVIYIYFEQQNVCLFVCLPELSCWLLRSLHFKLQLWSNL